MAALCIRKMALGLLCLAVMLLVPAGFGAAAEPPKEDTLVFGFLPILSTHRLVARFGPLTDYLAARLGKKIRLETAPNYAEFVRRTQAGRYDILFTAPHFYYLAQQSGHYQALVRVAAPSLHAVIVAPKDSAIYRLDDLKGKRLSTVDPLALGTILVRAHLASHGIDPDRDLTLVPTPTHNASLLSAYKRVTDAASLMGPPFRRAQAEIRDTMRVIATTDGTPHMPIAVASRMRPEDAANIRRFLVDAIQTEEGRALLKHLGWPGFTAVRPDEYDQLEWVARQLRLEE